MKHLSRLSLVGVVILLIMLSSCDEKSVAPTSKSSEGGVVVVYGKTASNSNIGSKIVGNEKVAWVNRDSQGNLIGWVNFTYQNGSPPYNLVEAGIAPFGTNPVGTGFNFSNYFNADWNGDLINDLICRDANGTLYFYPFDGNSLTYTGGTVVGNSFYFTDYMAADWNGDGKADLICRDASGTLRFYPFVNNTFIGNGGGTIVGNSFNFTHYLIADWNGDGKADLICRDASGTLRFYPFINNTFIGVGGGTIVGNGFNFSDFFIGEFTGDNLPDLACRNASGNLYLYPFGNNVSFIGNNGGRQIGSGFNYVRYFPGDWNFDNLSDFMCLDSSGNVALYQYNNGTLSLTGVASTAWNYTDYFAGLY
ncbi:MAG TPA: VCBS repeat-containing protein [Cyclobacteriaceae bacterium]|nr:VCBS repeat-containing protein [Cyclobacteriaceae bacterium]